MTITLIGATIGSKANFMTLGWITRVNYKPPMLAAGIHRSHYTVDCIKETKTFSVNFPSVDMMEKTDYCGLVSGKNTDKSNVFEVFYGELKTAPMIRDFPLCLECELVDIYEKLPTNSIFIGEIMGAYTEDRYLTDGKLDIKKMNPLLLTMPDNSYWTVGEHAGKAWGAGRKLMK